MRIGTASDQVPGEASGCRAPSVVLVDRQRRGRRDTPLTVTVLAWIARSTALAAAAAILAYVVVLPFGGDGYTLGEYGVALVFGVAMWPFYLAAVFAVSRRAGRAFRWRALAGVLILMLPLNFQHLLLNVSELVAADIAYVAIGLLIAPAPRGGF